VSRLVHLLGILLALACASRASAQDVAASFQRGVDAYRHADYDAARAAWEETLAQPLEARSRARVLFDLGNAHWRAGRTLEAIACYGAAVRLDPRHADAWQNLELARAKSELPPADSGDLGATTRLLLVSLHADERRALVFGALVLWLLVLILEIRFGGGGLRLALTAATLFLAVAVVPWAYGLWRPAHAPDLVVTAKGGAPLRAEPLEERASIGQVAPLEELQRVDGLPGWIRVRRADGQRGWVKEDVLYALPGAGPAEAAPEGAPDSRFR